MRFFLFCLRERACGSPRRMPQAQAHTVPSKSPASAPRSLFRRRSGGQTPFRRRLILPKRSRCDPKRPCGKSRTRPFSPTGESLRQPVRQSISAAPPTAERLRRFCNASSGFLRMKRTVPAAVPAAIRSHPRRIFSLPAHQPVCPQKPVGGSAPAAHRKCRHTLLRSRSILRTVRKRVCPGDE